MKDANQTNTKYVNDINTKIKSYDVIITKIQNEHEKFNKYFKKVKFKGCESLSEKEDKYSL